MITPFDDNLIRLYESQPQSALISQCVRCGSFYINSGGHA